MIPADDNNSLSLLYHFNSEPRRVADAGWVPRYKQYDAPLDRLPAPEPTALNAAMSARKSCREFATRAISAEDLSALLAGAYGICGIEGSAYHRAVPSAGGLYPLELYVWTKDGVAHYNVRDHALENILGPLAPGTRTACFFGQPWVEDAPAVIVITAEFARTQDKYGNRGYRFALLEAGHVAQNLCLLAGERSLGAVCLGGFRDALLNAALGLDGRTEAALYAVAVGHPSIHDKNT